MQSLLVLLLHFLWSSINQSTMHRVRLRKGYCSCKSWITAHARWAMPLHCKLALQRLQRKRLQGDPNSQTQTLQTLEIEELNEKSCKRLSLLLPTFKGVSVLVGVLKTLRMVYKSTLMYVRGDKATPQRHSAVSIYCLVWHRFCFYIFITQSWRWLGCRPDGRGTSLFGAAIGYFARPSWLESKGLEVVKSLKAAS